MEPFERFCSLVRGPEADLPLDEAALLISAHAHPGLDVDAWLARLDEVAGRCVDARTPAALCERLFVDLGYAGDTRTYHDARNSYLDEVIERRLGIPITLSVLAIEVGRRVGVALHGVGMPGHFLVGATGEAGTFFDAFHQGVRLDAAGAEALFTTLHGPAAEFSPRYLEPTPTRAILRRMLENLLRGFTERQDAGAAWVARLILAFPDTSVAEQVRSARVLATSGHLREAASVLDAGAEHLDGAAAQRLVDEARRLRARLN